MRRAAAALALAALLTASSGLLLFPDGDPADGAVWSCPFPRRAVRCDLVRHLRAERVAGRRPAVCLWDHNTAEHPSRLSQLHDPASFVWDRNCSVGRGSSLLSSRLFALAGDEYWEAVAGYMQQHEEEGAGDGSSAGPLPYFGLVSMEAACYKPRQQTLLSSLRLRGLDVALVLSDPPATLDAAGGWTTAASTAPLTSRAVSSGPRLLRWSYGSTWASRDVVAAWRDAAGDPAKMQALVEALSSNKSEEVSMIVSSKVFTEGHVLRQRIAAVLRSGEGRVSLYGPSDTPLPPGPTGKSPALAPYRYTIVMENCLTPRYFTEKLLDALLAGTVPLYYGSAYPLAALGWGADTDPGVPGTSAARDAALRAAGGDAAAAAASYGEAVIRHALARRVPILPFATPQELGSLLAAPSLRDPSVYKALVTSALPRAIKTLALPHAAPDDWLWETVFSCAYNYYWGLAEVVPGKHCVE